MQNNKKDPVTFCGNGLGEMSAKESEESNERFCDRIQKDASYADFLKSIFPPEYWEKLKTIVHAKGINIAGEDD